MNIEKPISSLFGIAILGWIAYIVIATNSATRIERSCSPLRLVGNATESIAALTAPSLVGSVREGFGDWDYGCQFLIWRAMYEGDFKAAKQRVARNRNDKEAAEDMASLAPPVHSDTASNTAVAGTPQPQLQESPVQKVAQGSPQAPGGEAVSGTNQHATDLRAPPRQQAVRQDSPPSIQQPQQQVPVFLPAEPAAAPAQASSKRWWE